MISWRWEQRSGRGHSRWPATELGMRLGTGFVEEEKGKNQQLGYLLVQQEWPAFLRKRLLELGTGIKYKVAERKVGGEGLCVGDESRQEGKAAAGDLLQSWE